MFSLESSHIVTTRFLFDLIFLLKPFFAQNVEASRALAQRFHPVRCQRISRHKNLGSSIEFKQSPA